MTDSPCMHDSVIGNNDVIPETLMIENPESGVRYPVFRKRFHIPSRWAEAPAFRELAEHRYEKSDHVDAYDFIENRLKQLNYHADNKSMVHDFLHFLICDLLDEAGVPYITEQDLKSAPALSAILERKTPDLIVGPKRPLLPMALDIFVGTGAESVQSKKEKYKGISTFMNFDVITFANLRPLACVLSREDLKYIQEQLAIFMAEYQYWHACLKLKRILFNDIENVPIRACAPIDHMNVKQKVKLVTRLEGISKALTAFKNGDDDEDDDEDDDDDDDHEDIGV